MIKVDGNLISEVSKKAASSGRLRTNYNFHKEHSDRFQRLLNAAEPGTYIRPHKHDNPEKVEAFIVLRGSVVVVEFDDAGAIVDHALLCRDHGIAAVELAAGAWHSFICLESGTVLYEAKPGPYDETADKHFASWAPAEGALDGQAFNQGVLAKLGIRQA